MLKEGLSYTVKMVVTPEHTADTVGSGGLPVFATPIMIGLMENAAMQAVAPELADGETTVGAHIETNHLAPTAIGGEVEVTATLKRVDGRKLYFDVEAREGDTLLGRGTHTRVIVNADRFLAKLRK